MEDQILNLEDKKREITGINVSLKAKLASLQKLEQDVYNKLKQLENNKGNELNEKNTNLYEKDNERTNVEANNRLQNVNLNKTLNENEDLKYTIETGEKIGKMTQDDFDADVKLIDDLAEIKGQELSEVKEKINALNEKAQSIPGYKEEEENNAKYKEQIEELKEKYLKLNTDAECAELANNYLIKKKEDVINERKKYIDLNIELKHEIEAKITLNDNRIQKESKRSKFGRNCRNEIKIRRNKSKSS